MKKAFTLLELIIVVVIIGILATLGLTQYTGTIEKARRAEVRRIFGNLRNLAAAYRLEKGTINSITNADLNIGSGADQIPDSCKPTHYFYYWFDAPPVDPAMSLRALRCTSGGKPPQGSAAYPLSLWVNFNTGDQNWQGNW